MPGISLIRFSDARQHLTFKLSKDFRSVAHLALLVFLYTLQHPAVLQSKVGALNAYTWTLNCRCPQVRNVSKT